MAQPKRARRLIRLEPIPVQRLAERKWLHDFIRRHHSAPRHVHPTMKDLLNPSHRFFRATLGSGRNRQVIGVTSYEVRTPYLVETQKTIVDPRYRGQGFGREISDAIEREVRRAGFKKIRTTIYVDNHAMIAIKLAQGYRIEGYHEDHDAPGLHEYSLGKVLR